jgi:hypothetical protein
MSWRGFIEWWAGLRWAVRFGVAGGLLLAAGVALLLGQIWFWAWAVGVILLMSSLPNKAERRGYHDF